MGKSPKWIVIKEILVLNDTLDQIDLVDTFGTFQPKQENTHS